MPKIKLFRVSGYCCANRNYGAHLFAQQRGRSISPLPVTASVAKARLIFITFRELRLARGLNWRTRVHIACSRSSSCQLGKLHVQLLFHKCHGPSARHAANS